MPLSWSGSVTAPSATASAETLSSRNMLPSTTWLAGVNSGIVRVATSTVTFPFELLSPESWFCIYTTTSAAAARASTMAVPAAPNRDVSTRVIMSVPPSECVLSVPRLENHALEADAVRLVAVGGVLVDGARPIPEHASNLSLLKCAARLARPLRDVEAPEADHVGRTGAVAGGKRERRHQDEAHPPGIAVRRRGCVVPLVRRGADPLLEPVVDLAGKVPGLGVHRVADRIRRARAVLHLIDG